jgi:hypothetical protein
MSTFTGTSGVADDRMEATSRPVWHPAAARIKRTPKASGEDHPTVNADGVSR